MALIAGLRIVAVSVLTTVFIVHFTLSMFVTLYAFKGAGASTRVTVCTRAIIMRAGQRKCVVEVCRCPGARRMALCTVLGETEGGMVLSALIIAAVAGVAVRAEPGQDAPGMTLRTIQAAMSTCQGKG
jgi:hypothetical protein